MIPDPWPHLVVDGYYDPFLFDKMVIELEKAYQKFLKSGYLKTYDYIIIRDVDRYKSLSETKKCIESNQISEKDLLQFPEYRPYQTLKRQVEVIIAVKGLSHPIHDEVPEKVLSVVTYVSPEKSTGTLIYNEDRSFHSTIEWKPNRSLIFAGIEGKTWHSYECLNSDHRISINQFLVRR